MATLDRDKALDMALAQIDKQFGKGSVMRLGDSPEVAMKVIPTGSIALDIALGVGGLPRGRVVEIYGPEASGKTTVALHSVAALVPRAEIEGEMGDSHVGLQARLMSQALRKITGALSNSGTTCIFINQLREKVGVVYGSPEVTTGGRALKFYASVRIDIRRIETLKQGTDAVGSRVRVKVVKNKVAAPFKQAELDILWGQGFSREGGLIDVGVEQGMVRKSGAWYTYEGDQLGQGKENARNFLKDNPDLADEIEKKIKEKLGIGATLDAPVPVAPVDF